MYPAIVLRVFFMFSASLLSLMIGVKSCLCFPVAAIRKYASVVVKKEEKCIDGNETGVKMKSLQHGVFPGGHPSKY